jgi:hypothetical protein
MHASKWSCRKDFSDSRVIKLEAPGSKKPGSREKKAGIPAHDYRQLLGRQFKHSPIYLCCNTSIWSLCGNVPQYFISQATLCRYARFRPFPSIERNLNGILGSPGKRKAGPKNVMAGTKKQRKRCREPMFSRLIRLES